MAHEWVMSPDGEWDKHVEEKAVTSWNDLSDKPFGDMLVWKILEDYSGPGLTVSGKLDNGDSYCTIRNGIGIGDTDVIIGGSVSYGEEIIEMEESHIDDFIFNGLKTEYTRKFNFNHDAVSFYVLFFSQNYGPPAGTYDFTLLCWTDNGRSFYPTIYWKIPSVIPLDSKYLPKASSVSDATSETVVDQFNSLLSSLRDAGYLAE